MFSAVGVIGCGVTGGALARWFEEEKNKKVFKYDPKLGFKDDISQCDIVFICVPADSTPEENLDSAQDLSIVSESISRTRKDAVIFLRTTVLPGTTDALSKKHGRRIYFMPEFLTERCAYESMKSQNLIVGSEKSLKWVRALMSPKKILWMSNQEAELAKYIHNCFGAMKVSFFNMVYEGCKKESLDFEKVRRGVLLSGYISEHHTMVPGPDGKFGFGGKCFPKDLLAFLKLILYNSLVTDNGWRALGVLLAKVRSFNSKVRPGALSFDRF